MRTARITESVFVNSLKKAEAGLPLKIAPYGYRISRASFKNGEAKFSRDGYAPSYLRRFWVEKRRFKLNIFDLCLEHLPR